MSHTSSSSRGFGRALVAAAVPVACVFLASIDVRAASAPLALGSREHVTYAAPDARSAPAPDTSHEVIPPENAGSAAVQRSGNLVITPTFDASITGNPNAAAIEAMINSAIAIYEAQFDDPITVSIRFRYSTTLPDGSAVPGGALALSNSVIYTVAWNTFVGDLMADATTSNDAAANASLPGSSLTANVVPSSADGRALGLNTPPAMFANGSVGAGGPYDGIVTLNANQAFTFTRPASPGIYDALRTTEHEMDEILGLGSAIGFSANVRPQDLFSWSAPGTRNLGSSGLRYFSIDAGTTDLVDFNQDSGGDFGDWDSPACPQANPYVQNAFSCDGQSSDVTQTSPEGVNLDVIGYDLLTGPTPTPTPSLTPTPSATPTLGPLDHFTCYKAGATKGSAKFPGIPVPPGVALVDEIGGVEVSVRKPTILCAPTDAKGNDPSAPTHPEHLEAYQIRYTVKPVLPKHVHVIDQFNPAGLFVDVRKPLHLFLPTAKSLTTTPPTPTPFVTDHFECYQVKVSARTPKFTAVAAVSVADQFGAMTLNVKKPAFLCNPVDKNGEDPTAPTDVTHLMCYAVKQIDAVKFAKIRGVFVNNQFGQGMLDVQKPAELCVPALASP